MASAKLNVSVKGGNKVEAYLRNIAQKLGSQKGVVRVGFHENAKYPGGVRKNRAGKTVKLQAGLSVAQVGYWNEFGTKRAPPRPFFRGMIADKSPQWGTQMAKVLKATGYDQARTLALMGEKVQDQLIKSIVDFTAPGNAPRTIADKGFDKALINTAVMVRGVGYDTKL